jgi:hypothetical protein
MVTNPGVLNGSLVAQLKLLGNGLEKYQACGN